MCFSNNDLVGRILNGSGENTRGLDVDLGLENQTLGGEVGVWGVGGEAGEKFGWGAH